MLFRGLTIPGQAASNDESSRNHSEMPQLEVDPKGSRNAAASSYTGGCLSWFPRVGSND